MTVNLFKRSHKREKTNGDGEVERTGFTLDECFEPRHIFPKKIKKFLNSGHASDQSTR